MRSVQQPSTGNAELAGDGARDGLGLVVATSLDPVSAGRSPRHHIDARELEPTHHVRGQHARDRPSMTELQRDYQLPRRPLERERGTNALGAVQRTDRRK
ncbi:MAG: hypothetical protein QOE09_298 [Ilumatobacteraceae bacterium]